MLISSSVDSYIPPHFQEGRPIEHIILVCDVDGVIRYSTEADADPRVIASIKELIATQKVDVAFISGTPIAQDPLLETWRRGNITLDKAVGSYFVPQLQEKKVTIYGALGGQRMAHECRVELMEQYSLEVAFEVGKLLLYAFLEEVENDGTPQQKKFAKELSVQIDALKLINMEQSPIVTADEFGEIVVKIRSELDQNYRLVSYGAFVESQTSHPPWNTVRSLQWIRNQLHRPHLLISQLPDEQKQLATGVAHREDESFNFLMISKTNKSLTIRKHMQEKMLAHPDALVVTIGDTQVDFPMHQHAHLAYHVGKEHVWKNHNLSQCMIVRDSSGRDSQHIAGTLHVLDLLKKMIVNGKIPQLLNL